MNSDQPTRSNRYDADDLIAFGTSLMVAVGMPEDRARTTAAILVEGDLLGHTTHGLALVPAYLEEIMRGAMTTDGEIDVIADHGAHATWDGRRLPGPWLVTRAIDIGLERVREHGLFSIAIRRSHHIACLAAYLTRVTDVGYLVLLATSDPSLASVAAFGGTKPIITPNPLAAGFPTSNQPILIDISMSTTSHGTIARAPGKVPVARPLAPGRSRASFE